MKPRTLVAHAFVLLLASSAGCGPESSSAPESKRPPVINADVDAVTYSCSPSQKTWEAAVYRNGRVELTVEDQTTSYELSDLVQAEFIPNSLHRIEGIFQAASEPAFLASEQVYDENPASSFPNHDYTITTSVRNSKGKTLHCVTRSSMADPAPPEAVRRLEDQLDSFFRSVLDGKLPEILPIE